jgi:RNA polymerase sigma-70 factor, ECF subfamily
VPLSSTADVMNSLKNGDESALKVLFDLHFQRLYRYALRIVNDNYAAEEIAQDAFMNLWKRREVLEISQSIDAYLTSSVRNGSINHMKKKYVILETGSDESITSILHSDQTDKTVMVEELEGLIKLALDKLPQKAALIFSLSRHSEMTNSEIALHLNISQKTVEYHMTNALKFLRIFLSNHGYCIVIIPLI